MTDVSLLLGLLVLGVASGLVPLVNAEALLTAATVTRPELWLPASVSIALGQSTAKLLIYLTARDGPRRLRCGAVPAGRRRPHGRWDRLVNLLRAPVTGTSVVALSATVGLPPLALVSVLAGTARLRLSLFVTACLAGRVMRFAAIAWPVAHLA